MVKKTIYISIVAFLLAALFSCSSDKEATVITQEANIDTYIGNKFKDSVVIRKNGSNRIIMDKGTSANILEFGDSLYLYFAGYVFSNGPSSIFATNVEQVAKSFALTDQDFSIRKLLLTETSLIPGLAFGLNGMQEGEHAIIVFSAKYGFYNKTVYNIPKLSPLIYEVWVPKIIKK